MSNSGQHKPEQPASGADQTGCCSLYAYLDQEKEEGQMLFLYYQVETAIRHLKGKKWAVRKLIGRQLSNTHRPISGNAHCLRRFEQWAHLSLLLQPEKPAAEQKFFPPS